MYGQDRTIANTSMPSAATTLVPIQSLIGVSVTGREAAAVVPEGTSLGDKRDTSQESKLWLRSTPIQRSVDDDRANSVAYSGARAATAATLASVKGPLPTR